MKICSKCKEKKGPDDYYKDKNTKDGLRYCCKECFNKLSKKWKIENKEKYNKTSLTYYHRNRERINKRTREYQAMLRECVKAYHEIYDRPETIQEFKEKWFNEKV